MPRRNDTMGGRKLSSVGAAALNGWLRGGGAGNTAAPAWWRDRSFNEVVGVQFRKRSGYRFRPTPTQF